MKPKPFVPEIHNNDERFVRDKSSGLVWHRVQNRAMYIDTDRSGVVYHSHYLRYFELGRVTLMRDIAFPYSEVEENGYVYPIVETGLKYHSSLTYDDPFWVHTRPDGLERVKISFAYLITHVDTGQIVCTGFTKHCALNEKRMPTGIDPKTVETWINFPK